jgi:regulator of protease activity HflC (stomatin/prohibitin superfamily)
MSNSSSPLIQTLTPERWAGWSMDFINAGYAGLLVKNGQLVRKLEPGRHFSFALPWIEQCQLILVDSKVRNLEVRSQGDFLSQDQFLVNISLNVMYQVIDPKRVALELSDPLATLTSAVKDGLGVVVGQLRVDQLTNQGRVLIRQYLLENIDTFYLLGFNLDDVRVSDINFPQSRGIIRQVEGMSARQEAEHEAALKAQIAGSTHPVAPIQQVNIVSGRAGQTGEAALPLPDAALEQTAVLLQGQSFPQGSLFPQGPPSPVANLPAAKKQPLPATRLAPNDGAIARLIHVTSGQVIPLPTDTFTIGREPSSSLVLDDPLCSRNHAQIVRRNNEGAVLYQLIDAGSSNGTFIDGQRLVAHQPRWLMSGNVVKIGSQEWSFET